MALTLGRTLIEFWDDGRILVYQFRDRGARLPVQSDNMGAERGALRQFRLSAACSVVLTAAVAAGFLGWWWVTALAAVLAVAGYLWAAASRALVAGLRRRIGVYVWLPPEASASLLAERRALWHEAERHGTVHHMWPAAQRAGDRLWAYARALAGEG